MQETWQKKADEIEYINRNFAVSHEMPTATTLPNSNLYSLQFESSLYVIKSNIQKIQNSFT